MTIVGYVFVPQNVDHQLTVIEQKDVINSYAGGNGLEIDEFILEESTTMKTGFKDRPIGKRVVECLENGDMIICAKACLVLGSARQALRSINLLRKNKISLRCVDLDEDLVMPVERKLVIHEGAAKVVQGLLDALALCESSRHGESIKAAKKQLKDEGKYLGGPVPFGWKVDDNGFLVKNENEQAVIGEIIKLRSDRWSYRDISGILGEQYGIKLSHEGIRKILERDENAKLEKAVVKARPVVARMPGLVRHQKE